jgi:L-ascorbate metabolism protein UlaG (beta-lactamase superfamily)
MTRIRFLGVAAYEIVTNGGQHILVDPFLDENPGCPIRSDELERVDLIVVSHAPFDHFGDTEKIARRTGAPVICGGEVKAYLVAQGIPEAQVRATTWGIAVEVAGIRVQPVECHHWSQMRMPDGNLVSGVPLSFVIYADPGVRFYHYGDTALFSDLRLIGELYQPTLACVGITQPQEILDRVSGPGRILTGEMSPREGVLAAQWLGAPLVLPCHYLDADCPDVREFEAGLAAARARGEKVPDSLVLQPGDILETDGASHRVLGGPRALPR